MKKITANKGISAIRKMNLSLPHSSLLTIYKSYVTSHLDYGYVMYDQPSNSSLSDKIESVHFALVITCSLKGTSNKKLYMSGVRT